MESSQEVLVSIRSEMLENFVGYHLRRACSVVEGDFARALAGTGIRQSLFGILSVIAENPGAKQGSVGRALGIKRANMVGLINELVEAGLVHRKPSQGDRRALSLSLTTSGSNAVTSCLERIRIHEGDLLIDLTAAERATLIALLRRVAAQQEAEPAS